MAVGVLVLALGALSVWQQAQLIQLNDDVERLADESSTREIQLDVRELQRGLVTLEAKSAEVDGVHDGALREAFRELDNLEARLDSAESYTADVEDLTLRLARIVAGQ